MPLEPAQSVQPAQHRQARMPGQQLKPSSSSASAPQAEQWVNPPRISIGPRGPSMRLADTGPNARSRREVARHGLSATTTSTQAQRDAQQQQQQ